MSNILNVSESQFEAEVVGSDVPVLVDFWADWCGPCRALAPVLEEVAAEFVGRAKVVKVNVDHCEGLAKRYGIMSIPAIKLFKNGDVVAEAVGLRNKKFLTDLINENL